MKTLLLVCGAGAVGSGARYLVSVIVSRLFGSGFPYGTMVVNVLGSFLIALIMQASTRSPALTPAMRLALTTGFLGGFTTYSTFNYDSLDLMARGSWRLAVANVLLTLVACLCAGALGWRAGRVWISG